MPPARATESDLHSGAFAPAPHFSIGPLFAALWLSAPLGTLVLLIHIVVVLGLLWLVQYMRRTRIMLERRLNEIATLNRIGQVFTANLSLDDLLKAIYEQVSTLFDVSTFYIALYDSGTQQITFPFVFENRQRKQWRPRTFGNGLSEHVIRTRQPLLLTTPVAEQITALGLEKHGADVACFLGVPLIAADGVLGMIAIQHDDCPDAYRPADIELMLTIAAQAAVTIRNARLFAEAEAVTIELYELVETARLFTASLDLTSVARTIVERLHYLVDASQVVLLRWRSESGLFEALAQAPQIRPEIAATLLDEHDTALRQVVQNRDSQFVIGPTTHLLLVPLVMHAQVLGVLALYMPPERSLMLREHRLIEGVAHQAASTLHNAITYSRIDASLDERVQELSTIEVVSRRISATLDLSTVINGLLTAAAHAVGAAFASCALVVKPNMFVIVARHAPEGQQVRLPFVGDFDKGISGRVLRTRQPALVDDTRTDPDYICIAPGMLSELCVPILDDDQPIGILNFENPRENAFTPAHLRFMQTLADHAAIAIQNARLFRERQRQVETLVSLRALSLHLLRGLDREALVQAAIEGTLQMTQAEAVCLYLRNGTELECVHMQTAPSARLRTPPAGHMLRVREVVQTGQPYYSEPVQVFPSYYAFAHNAFEALALIPIKHTTEVLGVLQVSITDPHYFTESELQALEVLANQMAVALQNARLYEAVLTGRDQLQAILDSTREAMLLFDTHGRLLQANSAAREFVGNPVLVLMATNVWRWMREIAPDDLRALSGHTRAQLREYVLGVMRDRYQITRREFEYCLDEDVRYIDETGIPVRDHDDRVVGWLMVWRDVTETRKLDVLREELSSMIVHDLRSPITSILTSLRMLEGLIHEESLDMVVMDEVIGLSKRSAENMLNLVQSLLDVARLEQNSLALDCESLSLQDVIGQAWAVVFGYGTTLDLKLEQRVSSDLPSVWMDDDKVYRVLLNLMDNALRHTPQGGTIWVEADYLPGQHEVEVRITDTGPGIPPDARLRVFDKFTQLDQEALRGHRGTGLGLTFCKLAIEAHGGRIWVEEGPTGGAAFCFTLPVALADDPLPGPTYH